MIDKLSHSSIEYLAKFDIDSFSSPPLCSLCSRKASALEMENLFGTDLNYVRYFICDVHSVAKRHITFKYIHSEPFQKFIKAMYVCIS